MPLRTACSSCGKKLQVRDELAGKKVKCPDCGKVFIAAAPSATTADPAAIKASPSKAPPAKTSPTKASPSKGGPPPMAKDDISLQPTLKKPIGRPVQDQDEDDDEVEDRPVKRGKAAGGAGSRRLLWIALAGVLVLGGAAGVYYFFFMGPPASVGPIVRKGGGPVAPVDTKVESKEEIIDVVPHAALADLVPGDAEFFATMSGEFWAADALKDAKLFIGKQIEDAFQKLIGFPLGELQSLTVFSVGSLNEALKSPMAPPVVIVAHTKTRFDQEKVKTAFQTGELGKNRMFKIEFANDQTILIGAPPILQAYKAKKGVAKATGVLERALAKASNSKGFVVAVNVPPEAADMAGPIAEQVPPPLLKIKAVLATIELNDKLQAKASVLLNDAASAIELKKYADDFIGGLPLLIDGFVKHQPAAKLIKDTLADVKTTVDDMELAVTYEADARMLVNRVIVPEVRKVQFAAASVIELNNLRQIGIAWHNYHQVHKALPPQTFRNGLSWRVAILPFIEQEELYRQFNLDEPWDSAHNKKLIPLMPKIYEPVFVKRPPGYTLFRTFVGPNTINVNPAQGMNLREIKDGTSNTLLVVEGSSPFHWTRPDDIKVAPNQFIPLGGGNPDFVHVLFADGAVKRLPRKLEQGIWRLLIDPSDGMPIPRLDDSSPKSASPSVSFPPKQPIPKPSDPTKPAAPNTKVAPEVTGKNKTEAKLAAAGKQLPPPKVAKIARGKRGDVGGGDKLTANLANHDVVVIKLEGIPATVKGFEIIRGASFKAGGESVNFNSVLGSPPGPVWVGAVVPANAKTITITLPGNIAPFTVDLPAKVEDEVKAYD